MAAAREPRRALDPSGADDARFLTGCLCRCLWAGVAWVGLLVCSVAIVQQPGFRLSVADLGFVACLLVMPLARFVEDWRFADLLPQVQTRILRKWYAYLAVVLGAGSALWLLAHTVAWAKS